MVQFSKNVKKKINERIDKVSDPLYFLKDQTSHYKYMHFFFKNGLLRNKYFFYCLFLNYPYIHVYSFSLYIGIYIYICMYVFSMYVFQASVT